MAFNNSSHIAEKILYYLINDFVSRIVLKSEQYYVYGQNANLTYSILKIQLISVFQHILDVCEIQHHSGNTNIELHGIYNRKKN